MKYFLLFVLKTIYLLKDEVFIFCSPSHCSSRRICTYKPSKKHKIWNISFFLGGGGGYIISLTIPWIYNWILLCLHDTYFKIPCLCLNIYIHLISLFIYFLIYFYLCLCHVLCHLSWNCTFLVSNVIISSMFWCKWIIVSQ